MPEGYWAAISTLIVMQSTLGAALRVSVHRFAGTALGASIGALVATRYMGNPLAFGVGVFAIGILCAGISADRAAYRYASITLAIVMLIAHKDSAWITALHRFIEVSVGLAVGLAVTAVWPERRSDVAASP